MSKMIIVEKLSEKIKKIDEELVSSTSFSIIDKYGTVRVDDLEKDLASHFGSIFKKTSGNILSADICIIFPSPKTEPVTLLNPSVLDRLDKEEIQRRVVKIKQAIARNSS